MTSSVTGSVSEFHRGFSIFALHSSVFALPRVFLGVASRAARAGCFRARCAAL
jgi:hypothetical protein